MPEEGGGGNHNISQQTLFHFGITQRILLAVGDVQ